MRDAGLTLVAAVVTSPQIYIDFGEIFKANTLGECSFTEGLLSTAGGFFESVSIMLETAEDEEKSQRK